MVLLIQGDPKLLDLTRKCLLLQEGLIIETAVSSSEAFNKIKTLKPKVIVCDLSCSFENIFDFIKNLRDERINTPLISLAFDEEKNLVSKALDLGASSYLFKSSDVSSFYEALKKLIDSSARSSRSFS